MMIVAHVQQHSERPRHVFHKVVPRMLALSDEGHRRIQSRNGI